jgi:hypothetical protein
VALSTRELLLVLRISDRTGGALRRVSRDIGGLTSRQNLQIAQKQQQIAVQRANTARRTAAQSLISARSGSASLRVEAQRLALERATVTNKLKSAGLDQEARRNAEAQLRNTAQVSRLGRYVKSGRGVRGYTLQETQTLYDAALKAQQTLTLQSTLIEQKAGLAAGSLNGLALREQQVAAATAELAQREGVLKERFRTTSDAARLQAARLRELQIAQSQLRWDRLERGAQLLQHIGRAAAIGGVVGTLALGGAARQAATLQTQVALAATQARPIGAPATATLQIQQRLMKVVLDQMKQFPATSEEMANALYELFSGTNIKIGQAQQTLQLLNQTAVAGGTDLGSMTQAMISLINNFDHGNVSIGNLTREANTFFSAVRFGRMNAQQFADSFSNVIPIAKEAGLQFRDVADAMAFLTRQSGARFTPRDATGLARLIDLFGRKEVQQGLSMKGVDIVGPTGKLKPLLNIITQIQEKINLKPGVETNQFFKNISALGGGGGSRGLQGTQQARRVFAYLINDLKQYQYVSGQVNRDNTEFTKSFEVLSRAPGVRWGIFTNQLKALAILIGTDVIPGFVKLGGYVESVVNHFERLSPSTRKFIAEFALFASVGAVVGGAILAIVGGLASLVLTARLALRSFGLFGSEVGAINPPVAIAIVAFTTLSLLLIKYPHLIQNVTKEFGGVENVLKAIGVILTGMALGRFITNLTTAGTVGAVAMDKIAGRAAIAESTIGKVRGGLIALQAASPYIIAIVVSYALLKNAAGRLQRDAHNSITRFMAEGLANGIGRLPVIGRFAKAGADYGERFGNALTRKIDFWLDKNLVRSRAVAKAAADAAVKGFTSPQGISMSQALNESNQILNDNMVPGFTKTRVQSDVTARRWQDIHSVFQDIYNLIPNIVHGIADMGRHGKTMSQAGFDKAYLAQLRNVARLQTTYLNKPTLDNYRKFHNSLNAINSRFNSETYKGYTQDYLGRTTSATKKAIGDRAKIGKSQFFSELRDLVKLRNAYLQSHDPKDAIRFYDARKKLAAEASASERRYMSDAVSRTDAAYKKQISTQKAAVRAQNQMYADALSNLTQMYNQFFGEQQANFGNLFQGPVLTGQRQQVLNQWGVHATGRDLLKDLRAQNFQYNRFNRLVGTLGRRGAPQELVNQLTAAGPAAMQDVYNLTKMTPAQWKQYVAAFKEGQAAIKRETMAQLNTQIGLYKQHGKNIARAIVAGITSEDQRLQRALDNMLRRALGLKPTADYKPSAKRGNVLHDNRTTIHVTGHPGDVRTKTALKHAVFTTRAHTHGAY